MSESHLVSSLRDCLTKILPRYPVKLAYLYGSAASGKATPLSDIDVAFILPDNDMNPGAILAMELQLAEEISRQCDYNEIDARIINSAPLLLRGEVVTNGILLYSSDEDFRVEFETSTYSAYFDFLPFANQLRQAYFDKISQRGLNGQP